MQDQALADECAARDSTAPDRPAARHAGSGSCPFVIGVTGHRNLIEGDLDRVRSSVAAFLTATRELLPDTDLVVMLGMAAGGDLVVARTALELGIAVEAVLPMRLADFIEDFDEHNRKLLMELLSHANLRHVQLPAASGSAPGPPSGDPGQRTAAYRNLTEVLIRKSNLMLALWDGKASHRPGGTTETVLRRLHVRPGDSRDAAPLEFSAADPDVETDSPFIYWIPISAGGTDAAMAATHPCFITGLGDALQKYGSQPPAALRRRLEELNAFNADFARVAADPRTASGESLLEKVPPELLLHDHATLAGLDAQYLRADTLAMYYQKRSDGLFGMFGTFAFVLGCMYLIYDKLGENPEVLVAYLAILLASLGLYRLLYTKVWFVKHLRYRALAETLRVMFFLRLAGVSRSVDAAEVLSLSGIEDFEGFGWIGYVLQNVDSVGAKSAPQLDPRCSEYVRTAWVDDQYRYFKRKVGQLERKSRLVSRWQLGAAVVTLLVLFIRMLFSESVSGTYLLPGVPIKNLLMLGAGVTALFLGAMKLHQSKMATRELIWQYKNQLAHFARSSAELERTSTADRRTDLLVQLGKHSLMESYLWTIHRYHREHAPPGA